MNSGALFAALMAREAGSRPAVELSAVALLGTASGFTVGRIGQTELAAGGLSGIGEFLASLDAYAIALMALLGLFRVLARVPEDAMAGWTIPYVTAGGSRRALALLTCAAVVATMYVVLLTWSLSFGAGHLLAGGGAAPLLKVPSAMARSIPLLFALSGLGLMVGLLARSQSTALSILAAAVAAPTILVITVVKQQERWPDHLARVAFLHLPPRFDSPTGTLLGEYAIYIAVVLTLAAWLAERRIGRCR
jgi:hypothetical protein